MVSTGTNVWATAGQKGRAVSDPGHCQMKIYWRFISKTSPLQKFQCAETHTGNLFQETEEAGEARLDSVPAKGVH